MLDNPATSIIASSELLRSRPVIVPSARATRLPTRDGKEDMLVFVANLLKGRHPFRQREKNYRFAEFRAPQCKTRIGRHADRKTR